MSWLPRIPSMSRFSPFGTPRDSPASPAPRVTEDDFSYITSEDIQNAEQENQQRQHSPSVSNKDHHHHHHHRESTDPRPSESSLPHHPHHHRNTLDSRSTDTTIRKTTSHSQHEPRSSRQSLGVPSDSGRGRSRSHSRVRHPSLDRERQSRTRDHDTDVIHFRHKGTIHSAHFAAWNIDEYITTVGSARELAAKRVGGAPSQIRMFWKGRNLRDDAVPLRDLGMRSRDKIEVMVVVGEGESDGSSGEEEGDSVDERKGTGRKKRKGRRGGKKSRKGDNSGSQSPAYSGPAGSGSEHLPIPSGAHPLHKTVSGSPAPGPKPAQPPPMPTPTTTLGKIAVLEDKFRTEYRPQCEELITNPPKEKEKREFEYKKVTETIMTQVLLKLDGVETEGDENARTKRKGLVKEIQEWLTRCDGVVKG